MATPNLGEIVTTTLRNRSGDLADNMAKQNALLMRLRERGNRKPFSGGRSIVQELEYDENETFMWYSGYETVNIAPSEVFTAAEFDIKQAMAAVSISGLEELQNSGEEAVIDLLESRIKNAERTFMNQMSAAVYADGTAFGGKQLGGLQLLVSDAPTSGIVGGIDRATWSFWRNQVYDVSSEVTGGGALTKDNVSEAMIGLYLKCVRGTDRPDLIVADDNYYTTYWQSLQQIQRITNTRLGEAGFENLKYKNADFVLDGGQGGACPANHMYMLNTNYIHFRPHSQRDIVPLGGDRMSVNQDATVRFTAFAGNMTISNCALEGVMIA